MPQSARSRRRQPQAAVPAVDDGPAPEAAKQPRRRSSERPRKRAKVSADAAKATTKRAGQTALRRSGRHQQDATTTGGGLVALGSKQPHGRRLQPSHETAVVTVSLPPPADAAKCSPATRPGMRQLPTTADVQPASEDAKADGDPAQGRQIWPACTAGTGIVRPVPAQRARKQDSDAVARRAARTFKAQKQKQMSAKRSGENQQGLAEAAEPLRRHSGRKQPPPSGKPPLAADAASPGTQSVPQPPHSQPAPAPGRAAAAALPPSKRRCRQREPAAASAPVHVQHSPAEPSKKRRWEEARLSCADQDAVASGQPKERRTRQRGPAVVRRKDGGQQRKPCAADLAAAAAQRKESLCSQPQTAPPDVGDSARLDAMSSFPAPAGPSKRQRTQPAANQAEGHDLVPESVGANPALRPPKRQGRRLQKPAKDRPDGNAQRLTGLVPRQVKPEGRRRSQRLPATTQGADSAHSALATALAAPEPEPARPKLAGSTAAATVRDLKAQIRAKRARLQPSAAELPLPIIEPMQRPHQSPRRIRAAAPPLLEVPHSKEVAVSRSHEAEASVRRAPDGSRRKAAGGKAASAHGLHAAANTATVAAQSTADHVTADEQPGCGAILSSPHADRGACEPAPAAAALLPAACPAQFSCDAAGVCRVDTQSASNQEGCTAGACQPDSMAAPDQPASPGPAAPGTASDPVGTELLAALRTFEDSDTEQRQFHECVAFLALHLRRFRHLAHIRLLLPCINNCCTAVAGNHALL